MRLTHLVAAMLATLLTVGCNNPSASVKDEQQTVTYTDDYGSTVEIPIHPTRIVSTSPAVTEIIYALGGSHLLVGRTDFCSYPPEVADVESIGGISNLNIEKIMSLSPDLVISGSMIPKKSTVQMGKMGVPTVCVIEQQDRQTDWPHRRRRQPERPAARPALRPRPADQRPAQIGLLRGRLRTLRQFHRRRRLLHQRHHPTGWRSKHSRRHFRLELLSRKPNATKSRIYHHSQRGQCLILRHGTL